MSILQTIGRWLRPERRTIEAGGSTIKSIQRDDHNPYWAFASSGTADSMLNPQYRATVRNRARMESQNNAIVQGILSTFRADLIGTGPRLQVLSDARSAANRLETQWHEWAETVNLTDLLGTALSSRVVDGEAFIGLETDRNMQGIQLHPRLYEADQIANPWGADVYGVTVLSVDGDRNYDGIEFDGNGNPVRYSRLRRHPGAYLHPGTSWEADPIPAEFMIHWFQRTRPTQSRGVSQLLPALDLLVDLREYRDAAVKAARTAASISTAIKSNMPPGDCDEIEEGAFTAIPIPAGSIFNLPDGWDAVPLKAEHPTTTYDDFTIAVIREIARCIPMPVAVALGDSSRMNYASGRLDKQAYQTVLNCERRQIASVILRRIFDEWMREGKSIRNYLPRVGQFKVRWHWDGHPHVDPVKEANAVETLFNAGLLDEERYWSERWGLPMDEAHERLRMARESRAKAGLPVPGDQPRDPALSRALVMETSNG